nr:hypothetical protein [Massilia sp.]
MAGWASFPATGQTTKDELDAAKNALELRIVQLTGDAMAARREAEARQATLEAERAALLAQLPAANARALA